ncbi:ATP-dependent Clp protease adaptor protein ClpS [Saccharopolyspora kobensis]|uniref:ATP-dependent Clp protease adapter protein ClpS n=2 Tax=Pseudonocardiaceae TaxID=2070 RepID=A0A1H6CTI9_9PSEU|nr:ATP-dependent Clp protease adaptor protein ClpS [Saccharopolyspora kobensis]SFC98510.1 ATP-dependent Clp protease adaptor protein ClpS [Saccharopolyspora kobensis]
MRPGGLRRCAIRAGEHVVDTAVTVACNDGGMTSPAEIERAQLEPDVLGTEDKPWVTVVWNDPVNLMSYVTYVLQKIFGYTRDHATKLMLDVHHKGRAVVSSGSKEKVEGDVAKLHAAGLWATMQKDS